MTNVSFMKIQKAKATNLNNVTGGEMRRIELPRWKQIQREGGIAQFLIVPTLPGIWTWCMDVAAVLSHRAMVNLSNLKMTFRKVTATSGK